MFLPGCSLLEGFLAAGPKITLLFPRLYTVVLEYYAWYLFMLQVATALLVAGSTLTFWIPCRLGLHSRTCTQASFKALGCSFQLTHMSRDDTLFN